MPANPRIRTAVFLPLGDGGRAAMVEGRIEQAITSGVLTPGDRLPTETELARALGVAPVTVREALTSLRGRGLVTTRRGRHGGSFIAEGTDALTVGRARLHELSRVALRDVGAHYSAILLACVELACSRAAAADIAPLREMLQVSAIESEAAWRRVADEIAVEVAALSQSARLTRELVRLHSELAPLLRVTRADADARRDEHRLLDELIEGLSVGDAATSVSAARRLVSRSVARLITEQTRLLDEHDRRAPAESA